MKKTFLLLTLSTALLLTGCGTLTGIPSHGGGKRFAVEQELIAASSRAAIKDLDLRALQNRRVALYVSIMGDQGSGTMSGGRYSIDALIRGEYLNNPTSETQYQYPQNETTATTNSGALSSVTNSTSLLNAPSSSKTTTDGGSGRRGIGLSTNGMGDYRNETLVTNPRDVSFLTNLIQTIFFLRGIDVVSPEYADADVFVTVDVFGTIRSRTELHLYNAETLKAQTKLEYFAVDRNTGSLLIKPTTSAQEATYRENFALWTGPYKVTKEIKATDGLMVSFEDIQPYGESATNQPNWSASEGGEPSQVSEEILRKRQQQGN